jgi:hypothetical protein
MQTPHQTLTRTQTQSIAEARDLVSLAARSIEALRTAGQRLPASAALADERAWLAAATRRVEQQVLELQAAIAAAGALPEFEPERRARGQALFEAWIDSVEALLVGISSQISANSPLIEVLFPHQKFDRLRRGGPWARAYLAELERRRRMAYVVRLAGEPEYAFLATLLARFDDAKTALEQHEQPPVLSPDELSASRNAVFVAADAVWASLHQARLLADAALLGHPGWFDELGLDVRPKKRGTRSAPSGADVA